jgi:O-antigen/teichoic acid export membrane protein
VLRDVTRYVIARALPAIVSFAALALFTHVVSQAAYGQFALVVAAVGMVCALLYQWLNLGALRFLSGAPLAEREITRTAAASAYSMMSVVVLLVGGLATFAVKPEYRALTLAGTALIPVQGWFDLNLQTAIAAGQPRRFGALSFARAALGIVFGALLGHYWGAPGLIAGLILAYGLPTLMVRTDWNRAFGSTATQSRRRLFELVSYGLPITATFVFDIVVNVSDRFFLAGYRGDAATGPYAAGYDLTQQSLTMLMSVVNLAAFPRSIRALEAGE